MTLCKPCQDRGRETEATKTMAGEPWCKWCFAGCIAPNQFTPFDEQGRAHPKRMKIIAQCKGLGCDRGITARSFSGYCSVCSNRLSAAKRNAAIRRCKTEGCDRKLRCSRSGYCNHCLVTNMQLRRKLYPSQRPYIKNKRARESYAHRKLVELGVQPVQEAHA